MQIGDSKLKKEIKRLQHELNSVKAENHKLNIIIDNLEDDKASLVEQARLLEYCEKNQVTMLLLKVSLQIIKQALAVNKVLLRRVLGRIAQRKRMLVSLLTKKSNDVMELVIIKPTLIIRTETLNKNLL